MKAESPYAYVRLVAALAIMVIGGTGMYSAVLLIKPAALEFGVGRAGGTYPYIAAMIGFGVGIGKAGDVLEGQGISADPYQGLKVVGVAFISLGVLGLVGALIQVMRIGRRLEHQGYGRIEPTPLGQVMGFLVLGVGILSVFVIFI